MRQPHLHLLGAVGVLDRTGPVTVAHHPVPVVVSARWGDGSTSEHQGRALAWTPTEVDVRFIRADGAAYQVWVPVADVRRAGPDTQ